MTLVDTKFGSAGNVSSPASTVHERLSRHILADGLPYVMDLARSHGPYLVDQVSGREILDFFMSFATTPLGYNHPRLSDPDFVERILPSALNKPSNSDFYTEYMAGRGVDCRRQLHAWKPARRHVFNSPRRDHLRWVRRLGSLSGGAEHSRQSRHPQRRSQR